MDIPDILKKDINDLIRIGKRLILQEQNLMNPLEERMEELHNKILDTFSNMRTQHFHIRVKRSGYISYLAQFVFKNNSWPIRLYENYNSFQDLFSYVRVNIENIAAATTRLRNEFKIKDKKAFLSEYDEYILSLKKAVALNLFEYQKTVEIWKRLSLAYNKKRNYFHTLFWEMNDKWDEVYELKVGDRVKYYHSKSNIILEGTVCRISSNHVFTYIIADKSKREIVRRRDECIYENKPEDSDLYKGLMQLFHKREIPDIWKENKLDFYD